MSPAVRCRNCAPAAAASRSDGGSCSRKSTGRSTPMAGTRSSRPTTIATRPTSICSPRSPPARPATTPRRRSSRRRCGRRRYLRTLADDDGRLPLLGDDDGGQLFPICGRAPSDCRDTLAAASVILDEPSLAVSDVPEEVFWMCGALPLEDMPRASTPWRSARPDRQRLLRVAHAVRRSSRVRRRTPRISERRARPRRRAVGRPHRRRASAPGRSRHRDLHDGSGCARSVPIHRDAQHGRAERAAAVGTRRSVPLAIASRRQAPRVAVGPRDSTMPRGSTMDTARSRTRGAFSRCTASGWLVIDHVLRRGSGPLATPYGRCVLARPPGLERDGRERRQRAAPASGRRRARARQLFGSRNTEPRGCRRPRWLRAGLRPRRARDVPARPDCRLAPAVVRDLHPRRPRRTGCGAGEFLFPPFR